uniref:Uncharacterized protein n=1 Tax=Cryptomonas curvata TaxID=233186 RepID=A0A7S0M6N9_9CRYP
MTEVNLSHNGLGALGAAAACCRLPDGMRSLNLRDNGLGSEGAQALLGEEAGGGPPSHLSPHLSPHVSPHLSPCAGPSVLGRLVGLECLNIAFNALGAEGATAAAAGLGRLTRLRTLVLE